MLILPPVTVTGKVRSTAVFGEVFCCARMSKFVSTGWLLIDTLNTRLPAVVQYVSANFSATRYEPFGTLTSYLKLPYRSDWYAAWSRVLATLAFPAYIWPPVKPVSACHEPVPLAAIAAPPALIRVGVPGTISMALTWALSTRLVKAMLSVPLVTVVVNVLSRAVLAGVFGWARISKLVRTG